MSTIYCGIQNSCIMKLLLYLLFFQKMNPTIATITNTTKMLPTTPPVMTAGKYKSDIQFSSYFYAHLMLQIALSRPLSFIFSSFLSFFLDLHFHTMYIFGSFIPLFNDCIHPLMLLWFCYYYFCFYCHNLVLNKGSQLNWISFKTSKLNWYRARWLGKAGIWTPYILKLPSFRNTDIEWCTTTSKQSQLPIHISLIFVTANNSKAAPVPESWS